MPQSQDKGTFGCKGDLSLPACKLAAFSKALFLKERML